MTTNCVSYENVMGALGELSRSKYADPMAKATAKQTVEFLAQNPKTAKLLEEGLSNASCSDLAQVVQSLGTGVRDAAIAFNAFELRRELRHDLHDYLGELSRTTREVGKASRDLGQAAQEIGKAVKFTTETVGYAGRKLEKGYDRFDSVLTGAGYASAILSATILLAVGVTYGRRFLHRRPSENIDSSRNWSA